VAEEAGTDVAGVVLNRVKDHESELDIGEVESMLGHQVIMDVPEHGKVGEALAVKNLLHHEPDHHVSERFRSVAAELAGIEYEADLQEKGFISKLMNKFR